MRASLRALREAGDTTTFEGMDPDGPLPHFITPDEHLSAMVDGTDYLDQKMAALAAHRTQITLDGPFFALSSSSGDRVWGTEFYRIAKGALGPVNDDIPRPTSSPGCDRPVTRSLAGLVLLPVGVVTGIASLAVHDRSWPWFLLAVAGPVVAAVAPATGLAAVRLRPLARWGC